MNKEKVPVTPEDPKWKVTFGLLSWWLSMDGRVFVISQRWTDADGNLKHLELLEKDTEQVKIIPYLQFYEQYTAGRLTKTSNSLEPVSKEMLPVNLRRDFRPDYNS